MRPCPVFDPKDTLDSGITYLFWRTSFLSSMPSSTLSWTAELATRVNFRAWNNLCKLSPLQKPAVAPPYCYKVNAKLLTLKCKVLCYSASNYLSSLTSCLNGDVAVYPAQASRGKREKKLMCRAPGTSHLHEKNLLLLLLWVQKLQGSRRWRGQMRMWGTTGIQTPATTIWKGVCFLSPKEKGCHRS